MTLYSYIENIVQSLKSDPALKDICFIPAYPPNKKPVPLKRVTVAMDCEKARFYSGALGDISEYGKAKRACILLKFSIYSPYSAGGEECFKAFSRICDKLIFGNLLPVKEISCRDTVVSPKADGFLLTAYAEVEGELRKEF